MKLLNKLPFISALSILLFFSSCKKQDNAVLTGEVENIKYNERSVKQDINDLLNPDPWKDYQESILLWTDTEGKLDGSFADFTLKDISYNKRLCEGNGEEFANRLKDNLLFQKQKCLLLYDTNNMQFVAILSNLE